MELLEYLVFLFISVFMFFCFYILLVLVSMIYSSSYHIAFRNSGFAVATVMIRISLVAPFIYGALLGVSAMIFVILLTLAYNYFVGVRESLNEEHL